MRDDDGGMTARIAGAASVLLPIAAIALSVAAFPVCLLVLARSKVRRFE